MLLDEIHEHVTPKTAVAVIAGLYVLLTLVRWVSNERKIRQLGGHTYRIRTWLPFGTILIM